MAAGLMARKSAGPTPLRHQPLGSRWLTTVCLAALRHKVVVKLAGESKQAGEVVKGGGAQSRSLVGTLQGKDAISPRPHNKAN